MFDNASQKPNVNPAQPASIATSRKEPSLPSSSSLNHSVASGSGQAPPSSSEIHTMPMEYYLGSKTTEAVKAGRPATVPSASDPGKNKKLMNIIIIAVVVVVVGASGWLLYKSFEQPVVNQPTTQNTTEPAPTTETVTVETPVETVTPTEEVVKPTETQKKFSPEQINKFTLTLLSGVDKDKDGLTDEEEALFGTNPDLVDSDNDLYKDQEEINHLYSPIDVGPKRLWEKDVIGTYTNSVYGYKILYPKSWLVQPLDASQPNDLMISSNLNEFINIMVFDKKAGQTLQDWYLELAPTVKKSDLKSYETYRKIKVMESPDGFTVYIDHNDKVVALNYNIGLKEEASFPGVFQMVINSFEFVTPEKAIVAPVSNTEVAPEVILPLE
ncbi:MAG: thrombospondin type 3 repeat-containing protein [Patescibacteria group bacterium]